MKTSLKHAGGVMRRMAAVAFLLALPAAGFDTRQRLHAPAGPLAEAALEKLAESAVPLERDLLDKHMIGVLKDMNLSADERAALEPEAEKAIDAALASWKKRMVACLRPILPKYGDDKSQASRVGAWTKEQLVPDYVVTGWTMPEWLPQWENAVETRLGAERAANWKKARASKRAAFLPQIDQVLEKWAETGRKRMDEALQADMPVLRKAAKLDMKGEAELMVAAKRLVDDHVKSEIAAGREMLVNAPDSTIELFIKGKTFNSRFLRPTDEEFHKAWRAILKPITGDEALAALDKASAAKKTELETKVAAALERSEQLARTRMETQIKKEVDDFVSELGLAGKRLTELEALAKRAVDAAMVEAGAELESSIRIRSSFSTTFSSSVISSSNSDHLASQNAVWKAGLKEMFSAEELQRVQESISGRLARMQLCVAKVTLAEMDKTMGLTAKQRADLEPLIAPQMTNFIREGSSYWRLDPNQLFIQARTASEARVREILDETQMAQWRNPPTITTTSSLRPSAVAVREEDLDDMDELPDVDAELSRYLHGRAVKTRAEGLKFMLTQVEDVRRVLKLPPETVQRLTTAAKGAVEGLMNAWRDNMQQWASEQTLHATPRTAKAVVANLGTGTVYTFRAADARKQRAWTAALDTLLSPPQKAAWQKVADTREDYRIAAMAAMTTLDLDRRRKLSTEQFAKVEKLVTQVIREFLPDIERSANTSWHLSYYSCLMPLAGVKKADLQAVLTEKQWKEFQQNDMDDAERYWQNVEMWRKLRLNPEEPIR